MKITQLNHNKLSENIEPTTEVENDILESNEIPEEGDTIRTKKMQMEGKVEKINSDHVFFRIADGRLMKTSLDNVIVVQKLADEDNEVMEDQELNEISNELLARYKTAAGKDASSSDKKAWAGEGDFENGNKRLRGINKATIKQFANDSRKRTTKEGSMGGINRCAPAQDVNYQKVLDRNEKTDHSEVIGEEIFQEVLEKWESLNELSVDTLKNYSGKARTSKPEHDKVKTLNRIKGYHQANNKIAVKTGDRTSPTRRQGPPSNGTYEESALEEFNSFQSLNPNALKKAPKSSMQGKDDIFNK